MIRLATPSDAEAIAGVHVRSWQLAYRGHIPDDFLASLSVDTRSERWAGIISEQPNMVAVSEGAAGIEGFVSLSKSRDPGALAGVGELTAIYVDPPLWRRGIGKSLLNWVIDTEPSRSWDLMILWVLRENVSARTFYEQSGWHLDGTTKTDIIGGQEVKEVRYAYACKV